MPMKIGNFMLNSFAISILFIKKTRMFAQIKESRIILWILLPVFLSLLLSAVVGLQLFQDGSSYLLEILINHSAVRHERLSILLFQYPTIFILRAFQRLEIDPLVTLPFVRLAFNLNYAIMPLVSSAV